MMIMAVLLSLALPSFDKMISDNRTLAAANSLAAGISLAKSQAVKLGRPVTMCPSDNGTSCMAASPSFDKGWLVFVDTVSDVATAPNLDTTVASGGVLMGGGKMENSVVVKTGQSWIRFLPRGTATEVSTMTVKPSGTCKAGFSWQQVDVGIAGRLSITKTPC